MALLTLNTLTRGLRGELAAVQSIWSRGKVIFKSVRESLPRDGDVESTEASLYKEDIPETILQNRQKHLPDKEESPYTEEKKKCILCQHNITPNYKNVRLLSQFVSGFSGIVYDRHITGLCSFRQKQLVSEVEKSRYSGLMPYTYKISKYQNDPRLFNPAKPIRPHPYF